MHYCPRITFSKNSNTFYETCINISCDLRGAFTYRHQLLEEPRNNKT